MKTLSKLIAVLIMAGFYSCCKEDDKYESFGLINGYDYNKCACCGGWTISIDGSIYLFDSIPENSNIPLELSRLPLSVKLDWEIVNSDCISRIIIQRIKLDQ